MSNPLDPNSLLNKEIGEIMKTKIEKIECPDSMDFPTDDFYLWAKKITDIVNKLNK